MMRQTQKRCRLKQRHDQQSCATGAGRVEDIEVTIIDGIAERIGAIRYEGLPTEAVRWAKAAILDTVGVTLAGAGEPCARIAAGVLGLGKSSGECLIFGSGQRAQRSMRRSSTAPRPMLSISTMSATRLAAIPRRRSCRRSLRSARC